LKPDLLPRLVKVIDALLEPDPADRPQSAADVLPVLAVALPDGEKPLWPEWAGELLP
jgi:hypothetical protein